MRPLSGVELEAIGPGAALRHLRLMAQVLRYTTVTQGIHWANDGFLHWHLTWFRWWLETGGDDYSIASR